MISINTKRLHLRNLAQNDADVIGDNFKLKPTEYACQKFKTEYVFHDSRFEGVDIELETAAAIVTDLRLYKQESEYCKEENQNIIEVALDYLSCGLDPEKSVIFIQSQVPALPELTCYYMNLVTVSRLQRNPTVKAEIQMRNFETSIQLYVSVFLDLFSFLYQIIYFRLS